MSTAQDIKDRLDIVSYIQQYVPDLKKAGRYYKACCPFHGEKTPSFVVNPDSQSWRCFGACSEGGDVFNFAMRYHNWSFREALERLGEQVGVQVQTYTPEQAAQNARVDRLRGLLATAADYYHQHLLSDANEDVRATLQYATKKRGFTLETITTWQIGYAPADWHEMLDALRELNYEDEEIVASGLAIRNDKGNIYDRFRHRLMIPIHDERGRVVGFGARALNPEEKAKYINSPQSEVFDKSRLLFGLHRARHAMNQSQRVTIVEGYMDVIQAHQAGFHDVVAQMGTALTETQLRSLTGKVNTLIMALDSDEAGQNATRRSLEVARQALESDYVGKLSLDMRVLQIEGAKDPDDILRETPHIWEEAVQNAMPVADFVIERETANITPETPITQRQAIAYDVLPILLASENDTYRRENLQKLSMRLRITEADLTAWADEVRRQQAQQKRNAQQRRASPPPEAPPQPGETTTSSSAEEPPLFFPDEPFSDAPTKPDTPSKPVVAMRNDSRATERYCLRMLLRTNELLYRANRRLRELAQEMPQPLQIPLREVDGADFSQSDYRIIFNTLRQSLAQHDYDPLDYLQRELDDDLYAQVEQLRDDTTDEIALTIGQSHQADLQAIRKTFARHLGDRITHEDWLYRVLDLRLRRLQRERDELLFLMRDAQELQDAEADNRYFDQYNAVSKAWHHLSAELAKQHHRF